MINTFTRSLATLLGCLSISCAATSQTLIWPGDVNDNGAVSGLDFLYWAHAFGAEGPPRPAATMDWSGQPAGPPWAATFPGGRNFNFADVDGNGMVDGRDLSGLFANAAAERSGALPDPYGTAVYPNGAQAVVRFTPAGVRQTARGSELLLDLELTGTAGTFDRFHGLSLIARLPNGAFPDHSAYTHESVNAATEGSGELLRWLRVEAAENLLYLTVTNVDHTNRSTPAAITRIALPLGPGITPAFLANREIVVVGAVVHDKDMNDIPVGLGRSPIVSTTSCSFTVSPVTGTNGVTYLNGCFAEAAGVRFYTPGAAWNPGIDVGSMDRDPDCPAGYEPVCGFNGINYANACLAEAAGVVDYVSGICGVNDLSCYDPNLILISSGTSLNQGTGVITFQCPDEGPAVLGCDGNAYPSACAAEAAGIRSYTTDGDGACIDPDLIDSDDDCEDTVDFVCGCNEETYINACYAAAAGVREFTPGPCNGTSTWCAEARVIECGDYFPSETTIGAGNQLQQYPGCGGGSQDGPDRVYIFQKTTAGDLQIGLEIATPGLNMDMFLITGDCNDYRCIGSSTTSNRTSNNEGIVVRDAPNGTYYIVVDQPEAGPGGDYGIEVSCGYLDCSESVSLDCGVTYSSSNAGGNDDVSAYTCGPRLNVENNGPERVHSFTLTEDGPATITLSGLSANLELFLLSECDRNNCLDYSQSPGTNPEQISGNFSAGTYYVVVDGYNGAISDYDLRVDCAASCELTGTVVEREPSACGTDGGSVRLRMSGGQPTYAASLVGPVRRTAVNNSGNFRFEDLPPGDYVASVEDGSGCDAEIPFTIEATGGALEGSITPTDASCGESGSISVRLRSAGQAPYRIFLTGTASTVLTAASRNFDIRGLSPGDYNINIVDAIGCSLAQTLTIGEASGDLDFTASTVAAGCDGDLGQIVVRMQGGTLPLLIDLQGPVSGSAPVRGRNFRVRGLQPGSYTIRVTDAFGCNSTQQVVVGSEEMEAEVTAAAANCGSPGSAAVTVTRGTPPYTIDYRGPVSGSVETGNGSTRIEDLPAGSYVFTIRSSDDCEVTETVGVEDGGGSLQLSASQLKAACGDNNSSTVRVTLSEGTPNYTLNYAGAASGTVAVDGTGTAELNLPAGTYTLSATDFSGCSATMDFTVTAGLSAGEVNSQTFSNDCGQQDNIRTELTGGSAPYKIRVRSDCGPDSVFTLLSGSFELRDLPNCTYTIRATDADGCSSQDRVTIDVTPSAGPLEVTVTDGACDGTGRIDLSVTDGEPPYAISYTGPLSDNVVLDGTTYRVTDVPAGSYAFRLTSAGGCEAVREVVVRNDGTLAVASELVDDECGRPSEIRSRIQGGAGPYRVRVTRTCDGADVPVSVSNRRFVIEDVEPCTYEIAVTDQGGCETGRTVTVAPTELFTLTPTEDVCDQGGSIRVRVTGGAVTGPFEIDFRGPVRGTRTDNDGNLQLRDLPAGDYRITVTAAGGCTEVRSTTVAGVASNLTLSSSTLLNDCGQSNRILGDIDGGRAPYAVVVTRRCDNTVGASFTTSDLSFELDELDDCEYQITVTDQRGCTAELRTTIAVETPDLFDPTATGGPCGQPGRIDVNFLRGTPPYRLVYSGPKSGRKTVNGTEFSLPEAPAGRYVLTVTDANDCEERDEVTVRSTSTGLELDADLVTNDCGAADRIRFDVAGGTAPFAARVTRVCDGNVVLDQVSEATRYELMELPACDYRIVVIDAGGCTDSDLITVRAAAPPELYSLTQGSGSCNEGGFFTLELTGGTPPYSVDYEGPVSNSERISANRFEVANLPTGTYTVRVTDELGCSSSERFTISNTTTDLAVTSALAANDCGQLNQLRNDIRGGRPPFDVEVFRTCDERMETSFTTRDRYFELSDLDVCQYRIRVTDAGGCTVAEETRVRSNRADLYDVVAKNTCDSSGFLITFTGGTGPYRFTVSGPTSELFENVGEELFVSGVPGDYSLHATSAEGCTERTFAKIGEVDTGTPPTVNFEHFREGASVRFENLSSVGGYRWEFGDGNTSSERDPRHTFARGGSFNVCLTVTNDCGQSQACRSVEAADPGSAELVIGATSGSAGSAVRIPVSVRGIENLTAVSGTFQLANPGRATPTHVTAAAILPDFDPATGGFTYSSQAATGVDLDPSLTVLFYLHFDLGTSLGTTAVRLTNEPRAFAITTLIDGTPTQPATSYEAGFLEVTENTLGRIGGRAFTLTDESIPAVEFFLSEPGASYSSLLPVGEDGIARTLSGVGLNRIYRLDPRRDGDWARGISTYEIYLAQQYLLEEDVPEFTAYQIAATDMDCNRVFSGLDLYLMESLLVGNVTEVPGCRSWTFVPDDYRFPTDWTLDNVFDYPRRAEFLLTGDTVVTFTGIKRGDLFGDVRMGRSAADLPLEVLLPPGGAAAGAAEVEVTLRLPNATALVSLQAQLNFGPGVELVRHSAPGLTALTTGAGRDYLRMSWYTRDRTARAFAAGEQLLRLTLRSPTGEWPAELLRLEPTTFTAEAFTDRGDRRRPRLITTVPAAETADFRLYPAAPNPTAATTTLTFDLPAAGEVAISVLDLLGRPVLTERLKLAAGRQSTDLDLSGLPAGAYHYRVRAGAAVAGGVITVRR